MLKKVGISVSELLDGLGVTDGYLGKMLKEGLEATKVISVVPIPPKGGKESAPDTPDAGFRNVEFIDVPDYNVRVRYLDMAYKLKGKYSSERIEHSADVGFRLIDVDMSKYPKVSRVPRSKKEDSNR